jgi:hypothetical protein
MMCGLANLLPISFCTLMIGLWLLGCNGFFALRAVHEIIDHLGPTGFGLQAEGGLEVLLKDICIMQERIENKLL